MPSARRLKGFSVIFIFVVITLLLWTTSERRKASTKYDLNNNGNEFYEKTMRGLGKTPSNGGGKSNGVTNTGAAAGDEELRERLAESAKLAKDNANAKAPKPDPPSQLVGVGSAADGGEGKSVAGRKKFGEGNGKQEVAGEETAEQAEITAELNSILKKSPSKSRAHEQKGTRTEANCVTVIVFSKSYCPHSKRAKSILGQYEIDPAPYIVELDLHPLGAGLQARLAELTGRRTVPNVLINAVSIGGGDDVAALDDSGKLLPKILELGGKKILTVKAKSAADEHEGLR